MICAVLKDAKDADHFESLLKAEGYSYKKKLARIFIVDTALPEFTLKTSGMLAGVDKLVNPKMVPLDTVTVQEDAVRIKDFPDSSNSLSSWARHRIVRRTNPFKKSALTPRVSVDDMRFDATRTGQGVDVYVLDTGIDPAHIEFANSNITEIGGAKGLELAHGSLVSACVVGAKSGMAPNVELFFQEYRALLADQESVLIDQFDAVYQHYLSRAATNRPAVLNCSFGLEAQPDDFTISIVFYTLLDDMINAGITICASAGNSNQRLDEYYMAPVDSHPGIIGVGATGPRDYPMWYRGGRFTYKGTGTGTGNAISIYAPGQDIICPKKVTGDNTQYRHTIGTSFSSPFTVAVLACMLEGYQRLTSASQVSALTDKLHENATKRALRFGGFYDDSTVHDRLLYLDPHIDFEVIEGLNPL